MAVLPQTRCRVHGYQGPTVGMQFNLVVAFDEIQFHVEGRTLDLQKEFLRHWKWKSALND